MLHNRQQLMELVETTIRDKKLSVFDALIDIQQRYQLEEEVIAAFVRQSHKLKEALKAEVVALKLVSE